MCFIARLCFAVIIQVNVATFLFCDVHLYNLIFSDFCEKSLVLQLFGLICENLHRFIVYYNEHNAVIRGIKMHNLHRAAVHQEVRC